VKRIDPLHHLGLQTFGVEIRLWIVAAGLLHLQALTLEDGKATSYR
jgi:hypothetical protein